MELYHTSPSPITEKHSNGLFGDFLCFSEKVYVMTAVPDYVTYVVEIEESDVIKASSLFYHDDAQKLSSFVAQVQRMLNCTEEEAEEILSERLSSFEFSDDVDDNFECQRLTAECSRALGFKGVQAADEQGFVWLLDVHQFILKEINIF